MNSPSNSSGSHGSNALLISPSQVRSKTESAEDFDDFEEIELRLESRFSSRSDALVAINKFFIRKFQFYQSLRRSGLEIDGYSLLRH